MSKPEKSGEEIEFLSQYEKYLRGKISYSELHHLAVVSREGAQKPAAALSFAKETSSDRAGNGDEG